MDLQCEQWAVFTLHVWFRHVIGRRVRQTYQNLDGKQIHFLNWCWVLIICSWLESMHRVTHILEWARYCWLYVYETAFSYRSQLMTWHHSTRNERPVTLSSEYSPTGVSKTPKLTITWAKRPATGWTRVRCKKALRRAWKYCSRWVAVAGLCAPKNPSHCDIHSETRTLGWKMRAWLQTTANVTISQLVNPINTRAAASECAHVRTST